MNRVTRELLASPEAQAVLQVTSESELLAAWEERHPADLDQWAYERAFRAFCADYLDPPKAEPEPEQLGLDEVSPEEREQAARKAHQAVAGFLDYFERIGRGDTGPTRPQTTSVSVPGGSRPALGAYLRNLRRPEPTSGPTRGLEGALFPWAQYHPSTSLLGSPEVQQALRLDPSGPRAVLRLLSEWAEEHRSSRLSQEAFELSFRAFCAGRASLVLSELSERS